MRCTSRFTGLAALALAVAIPTTVSTNSAEASRKSKSRAKTSVTSKADVQVGRASWYGPGFHGRRTASGERFNRNGNTLAHRGLPFGTRVRITNLKNGKTAVARVNDRGPFHGGRIADLSEGVAKKVGMSGVDRVKLEVVEK